MGNVTDRQRIFIGISITPESRRELEHNLANSFGELPARVLDPNSWHITLSFIGAIEDSRTREIIRTANKRKWPKKFALVLDHLGAFPDPRHAQILWCGVGEGRIGLKQLADEAYQLLKDLKIPVKDSHPDVFSPHLTISRLQSPQDVTGLINTRMRPQVLPVNSIDIFRSQVELGPQQYEVLASIELEDKESKQSSL